jgi:alpha-beta hydrolase superfamily lysophospholipase
MPQAATFTDAQGVDVTYHRWDPSGDPKAIVLIAHGASEHGARYDRFATFLTDNGFVVYAQDHRGHGHTGKQTGAGQAGEGGWEAIVEDQYELVQIAREAHPALKLALFGHSMGSMIAQRFIQLHGDSIDALVLSGSTGAIDNLEGTIDLIDMIAADAGLDSPAPLFAGFNDQFAPTRTEFDWLSRDESEVDKYIADPFCGDDFRLSLGFTRGMLGAFAAAVANPDPVRKDLPVLFITGENDPVSENGKTVHELEARWRDYGVKDLTALYYPDARHELLNETNRDDVQNDVLAWIERVVA